MLCKKHSGKKNAVAFQKKAPLKIFAMYVKMYAAYSDNRGSDNVLPIYLAELDTQEEKDQFEKIYREYKEKMHSIALKILKNNYDAEDAVDIAFHKLAKNFTNISHKSCDEIRSYIVICIRNTAIDLYRSRKRILTRTQAVKEDDSYEDFWEQKTDRISMIASIKSLPDEYRDVIFLRDYQMLSVKETSRIMNISETAVTSLLYRAHKKLKNILEGVNADDNR